MGEGIYQQARDGAIQIGQARDVTLNLVTGITRLPTDYASRIQNFLTEYLGMPEQPVPFGGRDADLDRLDTWLADSHAPPYLLLAAPAGRGKSALLVRWSQRLMAQSDTSLVFVPVSIRFRTNLAPVVFAALTARLAHLHGEEVPQTTDLTAERWRGLVSTYLARPLPDGRSLVLILDGVDEAADWEPGPDLFPLDPPLGLRVIISARYRAGDADAAPWLRRLGWERPGLACLLDLDPLTRDGVADVLQKMGFPLDVLAKDVDIVTELHRLSEGDPLLVRLYVDDLWARGEAAARLHPEDLRTIRPGLKGYFDRWWEDQRRLWGADAPLKEPTVQALFNLLACALGPLSREDVLALTGDLGLTTWTLEEALRPMARLVIGDGETQGYVFGHPCLGEYFHRRLADAERLVWEQRFLDWGRQTLAYLEDGMLAPEEAPAYVVQYYGTHLERGSEPAESLFALVSDGWRRAWEALEGTYAGFLTDVERAWRAARMVNGMEAAKGSPASQLGMEVRSALCLVSVNTLARNIDPMLLAALVEQGMWTPSQGLAYARQVPDPEQRAAALIGLVSGLLEAERAQVLGEALVAAQATEWEQWRAEALARLAPHLPESLLREALAAARAIEDARWRAEALIGLAPRLAELGYPQEALVAVRAIESERIRAKALTKLAAYLPEPLLIEALAVAREIRCKEDRAKILTGLVPHLSEPLKGETVREALATAREMRDSDDRAWALADLAPHLPEAERAEALMEALTAAQEIEIESVRAEALAGLAPHLPEALLGEALTAARAIKWEGARAEALAGLAPHLPEPERAKAVRQVLAAAWVIGDEYHRIWVLAGMILRLAELGHPQEALMAVREVDSSLAGAGVWVIAGLVPRLPEAERAEVLREMLTAARVIGDEDDRAKALAGLAPHLPGLLLREALAAALEIQDGQDQAKALVELAPHLPEPLLREALAAARKIRDGNDQAKALVGLVPHLPGPLLREALAAAREIKWEWARAGALVGLVPYLPETERTEASWEALAAAREIEQVRERAEALAGLAPYLPEAERIAAQREALAAARAIRDGNDQAGALAGLAPYLLEPLLREALAVAQEIKWEWARAAALAGLVPRLAELGHPREALAAVWEIEWEWERSEVLVGLAPYLPEPLLREALAVVQEIESEDGRAKALVALLPHLPEAERTGALRGALAAARETESESVCVEVLARLVPHLPKAERAEALGEALASARAIKWEDNRVEALVRLASHLAQLPCQRLYPLWQETLPILAGRTRKDLLADLCALEPVIAALGGAEAVAETFRAIQDVGCWWP